MTAILALFGLCLFVRILMLSDAVSFQKQQIDCLITEVQRLDSVIETLFDDNSPEPDDGEPIVEAEKTNVVAFRKAS